jgi:hypothetical protein
MHQKVTLRLQRCNICKAVSSKFLTAVNMNIAVLWKFGGVQFVIYTPLKCSDLSTKLHGITSLNTT